MSINFVVFVAYWYWIFPSNYESYKQSTLDDTYGDNWATVSYYYYRSIIIHTIPFLMCSCTIFIADIIFMESDWWVVIVIGAIYLIVNFGLSKYADTYQLYFLDWSIVSKISAYSPLVATTGFGVLALGQHFFLCLFTQTFRQRYEFEFLNYNNNVS